MPIFFSLLIIYPQEFLILKWIHTSEGIYPFMEPQWNNFTLGFHEPRHTVLPFYNKKNPCGWALAGAGGAQQQLQQSQSLFPKRNLFYLMHGTALTSPCPQPKTRSGQAQTSRIFRECHWAAVWWSCCIHAGGEREGDAGADPVMRDLLPEPSWVTLGTDNGLFATRGTKKMQSKQKAGFSQQGHFIVTISCQLCTTAMSLIHAWTANPPSTQSPAQGPGQNSPVNKEKERSWLPAEDKGWIQGGDTGGLGKEQWHFISNLRELPPTNI